MAQDKATSEEKLLRLIENPDKVKGSKSPFKKFQPRIPALKDWVKSLNLLLRERVKQLDINTINKGLIVLAVLLTGVLVFDFFRNQPDLSWLLRDRSYVSVEKQEEQPAISTLLLADYQKEIKERNIFSLLPKEASPKEKTTVDAVSVLDDFKLVGIIWADNPQAIIEDIDEKKTYLLNAGDEIKKIKIKKILKNKVIVDFEGEEMELM